MADIDNKLRSYSSYVDGQLVQLLGPNNTNLSYQYDRELRAFYIRESLITATNKHGATHVSTDLVPSASCSTPGLMSADDKCKLDTLVGTRLGVLGFVGAGFPDDGGWMQGDIILSAGSEYMSIERVGNVIRFVVDVPTPFTCAAEECFQVYWIQDETDVNAIRPPSCGGLMPGVNAYGELKVYMFPASTVINPNATTSTLNNKGNYPALIFKRYDDGVGTNEAELEIVLKRNSSHTTTVGWAFTPGATGTPECRWFLGLDSSGNRIEFKLSPNSNPNLFGALLYKNSTITKQMAIITGYESDVLSTNRYKAKWWSLSSMEEVGTEFTVTNLQQWDRTNDFKVLDSALDSILVEGQFIDVWTISCGATNCHYCKETPILNVNGLWTTVGAVEFGDALVSRPEIDASPTDDNSVNDTPLFDQNIWGLTNMEDPLLMLSDAGSSGSTLPAIGQANYTVNIINTPGNITTPDRRYLEVIDDINNESGSNNIQRPVFLWYRPALRNALMEIHFGRPVESSSGLPFPPIDVLLRAPISTIGSNYGAVVDSGAFTSGQYAGFNYIRTGGLHWHNYPMQGAIKIIINDGPYTYGQIMRYFGKVIDQNGDTYLATPDATPDVGSIFELLHEEYTTPAIRLAFTHGTLLGEHDVTLVPTVGTLDMSVDYSADNTSMSFDNFIKDFSSSVTGSTYWQDGQAETSTSGITTSEDGFYILNGGVYNDSEYYNVLRVMVIENQVWMWWNNLLMPASATQPYFLINDVIRYGKFGLRMWPGTKVRRVIVRSKLYRFSQYSLGQLEL